jgi:4-amino-4-deoxy-L-arabinose transferase-like glycosyltransferase
VLLTDNRSAPADRMQAMDTEIEALRSPSRQNSKSFLSRWILPGIAALALVLRLAPLLRGGVLMDPDSNRYIELAQGLEHGCGFARWINGSCAPAETLRTPGYPLFLAAMPTLRTAILVQGLAGAAVCLLIGLYVRECWGLAAAVAAELLIALDIPSILIGATVMSDALFQLLVAAGVVLGLWTGWRGLNDRIAVAAILAAATLLGAAILVRPLGIVLPLFAVMPVFLLPRVSWSRLIATGVLAFAIPGLFLFGWMARNDQRTGFWSLSSIGPENLYYFRAAGVAWYRGDKTFQSVQEDFGREIGWPMRDFQGAPPSLQPVMVHRALQVIRNDPAASVIMTLRCFVWIAFVPIRGSLDAFLGTNAGATSFLAASGDVTARIHQMLHSTLLSVLVALQVVLIMLVWVGVILALAYLSHSSSIAKALVLLPLFYAIVLLGLASGPEAIARYRLPVIPLLAMLAGVGYFGAFKFARLDRADRELQIVSIRGEA